MAKIDNVIRIRTKLMKNNKVLFKNDVQRVSP